MRIDITEAKLKLLVKLWDTMPVAMIAKQLKVAPETLRTWACQLRKKGVPLKRKKPGKQSVITRFLKKKPATK